MKNQVLKINVNRRNSLKGKGVEVEVTPQVAALLTEELPVSHFESGGSSQDMVIPCDRAYYVPSP